MMPDFAVTRAPAVIRHEAGPIRTSQYVIVPVSSDGVEIA
jgi:hypothetical protein